MGTKSAASYTKQARKPPIYSSSVKIGDKGVSPYVFGTVTAVDPVSRRISFNIIAGNIGPSKTGTAIPFHKDNLTLPEVDDVVPLVTGPLPESGLLGESYSTDLYYLPPISVNQELAQNSIIRTANITPSPQDINVSNQSYTAADTGFAFTDNGGGLTPQTKISGYTIYKENETLPNGKKVQSGFVVTIPNIKLTTIALVFGGMHYANPSWMEGQVPNQYKSNRLFVFADSHKSNIKFEKALDFITNTFSGYAISSVSGFSLGGAEAWKAVGKYPFVGLIDPSTNAINVNNAISSPNVIMVYRPNNWVGYGNIAQSLRQAAAKMNTNGNYAIYLNTNMQPLINPNQEEKGGSNHKVIPSYFFKNYGGRL